MIGKKAGQLRPPALVVTTYVQRSEYPAGYDRAPHRCTLEAVSGGPRSG